MILSVSICITLFLLVFYTTVGYLLAAIKNKAAVFFEFQNTFLGSIVSIGFYALFKSNFGINSVTITLLPILCFCIFLNSTKTHRINKRALMYFGLSIFILSMLNYLLYFRNGFVHTGYKDHSFYHIVASNINLFGIEYVQNIHAVIPHSGGIYHYWDLWHLSFIYDIGLFFELNCFESYVLVHKLLFTIIIVFGVLSALKSSKVNVLFCTFCCIIAVINVKGEFDILIHPKNYINFALILFLIRKIIHGDKLDLPLFFFVSIVGLFYNPLPCIPIIAVLGLFVINNNWKKLPLLILGFGVIVSGFLILYYKYYSPPITANDVSKLKFNFLDSLRHFFIYNGYQFLKVHFWMMLLLIVFYLKSYLNASVVRLFSGIILFSFLFSALIYTHFEQWQFTNNNGFFLTLVIIFGLQNLEQTKIRLGLMIVILLISIRGFFNRFRLPFYKGFILTTSEYYVLKQKKSSTIGRKIEPIGFEGYKYNDTDFLFSIKNQVPCHSKR